MKRRVRLLGDSVLRLLGAGLGSSLDFGGSFLGLGNNLARRFLGLVGRFGSSSLRLVRSLLDVGLGRLTDCLGRFARLLRRRLHSLFSRLVGRRSGIFLLAASGNSRRNGDDGNQGTERRPPVFSSSGL